MSATGIERIDNLFDNVSGTQPIIRNDPDRKAVGVIQDLLTGHGHSSMPNPRNSAYGSFGPATQKALLDFRTKKLGLDDPEDVKADHQTLLALVREPAIDPIAGVGYLTLALDLARSDLLLILSLVSIVESGRRFKSLNRNTDKAGLSFGLIQWAQKPGRLSEIVSAFKIADRELFEATFGGKKAADGMLAHVQKGKNGLNPDGSTKNANFDLIRSPWTERFIKAARNRVFQQVQAEVAMDTFRKSVVGIRQYAGDKLHSQRDFAFQVDLSNQHGDAGAKSIFNAVKDTAVSEAMLLQRMEDESVTRLENQFGVDSNEARATRDRRSFFRATKMLADTDLQD